MNDNIENSFSSNSDCFIDDSKWTTLFEYIKENRINLNVRQVF